MAYIVLNCETTQLNLKGIHNAYIKTKVSSLSYIRLPKKKYVFAGTLYLYIDVCTFVKFTNV